MNSNADLMIQLANSFLAIILVSSALIAIISMNIVLPVVAFCKRWWWGLIVLFIPFGGVCFTYYHWKIARIPFLTVVCALGFAVSIFIVGSLLDSLSDSCVLVCSVH